MKQLKLRFARMALIAAFFLPAFRAPAVELDPQLPHYLPGPCVVPKDAGYVRPDGSIFVTGASLMKVPFANWNEIFCKAHPGFKFSGMLAGSSVGVGGLVYNMAPFALLGRELWSEEILPFHMVYHREPLAIRVGRCSYSRPGRSNPLIIFVNKANPIERLTTEQVACIFTVGGGRGDITTWGQLGLTGPWKKRPIKVLGLDQRDGISVYLRVQKAGDFPFTPHYEAVEESALMGRVAADESAIAFEDMSSASPDVKIVAISESEGGYYSKASYEDVLTSRYPYTRYLYFYINRAPGQPVDPVAKEYLRMVFSREGQEALTSETNGFLPLSAAEALAELAKLE